MGYDAYIYTQLNVYILPSKLGIDLELIHRKINFKEIVKKWISRFRLWQTLPELRNLFEIVTIALDRKGQ